MPVVTINIEPELYAQLSRLAALQHQTTAEFAATALQDALETWDDFYTLPERTTPNPVLFNR